MVTKADYFLGLFRSFFHVKFISLVSLEKS